MELRTRHFCVYFTFREAFLPWNKFLRRGRTLSEPKEGSGLMTGSSTFSELLARETKDWIDEEISKGNEAWNARRPIDGLSNIHWDLVIHAASQLNEHLTCSGQNMTPGIFLCRCIQTHYPELLRKNDGTTAQTSDLVHCAPKDLKPWSEDIIRTAAANLKPCAGKNLAATPPALPGGPSSNGPSLTAAWATARRPTMSRSC